MSLYKETRNAFQKQLNDLFKKETKNEDDLLLKILCLVLYNNTSDEDFMKLYKLVGVQTILDIVQVFGGKKIKIPTHDKLQESLIIANIYYEKDILGKSWDEVKDSLPFEINSLSYGRYIADFKLFLQQSLRYTIEEDDYELKKELVDTIMSFDK